MINKLFIYFVLTFSFFSLLHFQDEHNSENFSERYSVLYPALIRVVDYK